MVQKETSCALCFTGFVVRKRIFRFWPPTVRYFCCHYFNGWNKNILVKQKLKEKNIIHLCNDNGNMTELPKPGLNLWKTQYNYSGQNFKTTQL